MKMGEKVKKARNEEPKPLPAKENEMFKIEGKTIEKTYKFKFLGIWLTSDSSNLEHIKKRKKDSMAALMNINNLEFNQNELCIEIKSTMYQSFVRPCLTYGLETLTLTHKEIEELNQHDHKLMKMMIGISKYSYNTQLPRILRIPKLSDVLLTNKLNLLKQLILNDFTRELIRYTYDMDESSMLYDAFNYLKIPNQSQIGENQIWELRQQLEEEINLTKSRYRREKDEFAETIRFLLTNPSNINFEAAKYMLNPMNRMRDRYNPP
jgi:hypothetical protein